MSEGADHGEQVVDEYCDACDRGVPSFLHEETLSLWLDDVTTSSSGVDETERRAETVCGDCADEVRELTDGMTVGDPHAGESTGCGLCDGAVEAPMAVLTLRAGDEHEGTGDRYPLCSACDAIFEEFLGNVPEGDRGGNLYTGSADGEDRSGVDDSVGVYDSLRVGDEIRVESRVAASVGSPSTRHEVAGTVEGRSEIHGIAHIRFEGEEAARLTRPAPTVDRLTLQSLGDGIVDLGTVTRLTVESRAPRDAEGPAETVLELDADSALIPDSLDLESSAD